MAGAGLLANMDRSAIDRAAGVDKSEEQAAMGAVAWSIAEPAPMERRRHQRVKVALASIPGPPSFAG